MSLLDDARWLAEPDLIDREYGCVYCQSFDGHAVHCPTRSRAQIVAALEAAERVVDGDHFDVPKADFDALVAALRSETA